MPTDDGRGFHDDQSFAPVTGFVMLRPVKCKTPLVSAFVEIRVQVVIIRSNSGA
jgi:hypothetical protein